METVQTLAEVEPWCLSAKPGEEARFSVAEGLSQEKASMFAREVNNKITNHVWIYVEDLAFAPEPTTKVLVRCSY